MTLRSVGRVAGIPLTAMSLCVVVQAAGAETWAPVHTSHNRMDWIDRDSLKVRHGLWSAWTRTQFLEPQRRAQDGVQFRSARTLVYFDCNTRRMGFGSVVFYADPAWKVLIGSISAPDIKKMPMEDAPSGSEGADLMEAGCPPH